MSWLSTTFGFFCFLTFLLATWASVHPRWEQMASDVASETNFTNAARIEEARKEAMSVDKQVHLYYHSKLPNKKKSDASGVIESVYIETTVCIRKYYEGEQLERFRDCIRHVINLHLDRLKVYNKIGEGSQAANGASRLKIWL
ncbi:uncharacterized protein [Drosophila takahashii]|uniref:uncharacterized protein n=1 Tax=Drosophila takahashii TaxID=29030 RepID=UPI00389925F0